MNTAIMAEYKPTLKERLEMYYTLQKELPLIEYDIIRERNKAEPAGSYQDTGMAGQQVERILMMSTGSLKGLNSLLDRRYEIQQELEFLENLIFCISGSEMRQILTVAYLNGGREKRWERVADHFQREITGEAYRKKADKFLTKLEFQSVDS